MPSFKYETHTHTLESSKCSSISGAELVHFYKKQGFSGLCITDHFFNGNTSVSSELTWASKVDMFCQGYENARTEGKKQGLKVFLGWEYCHNGTELLTYGLDKAWLLNHPELLSYNMNEYCELVHESGGFIVHAHPFREADYIDMIRLLPRKVDAVEVINAQRTDFENERAREYAQNYDLLQVAGSDTHFQTGDNLAGIETEKPVSSINELLQKIKTQQINLFTVD